MTTKVKSIKELFVKDLARVRGGEGSAPTPTSSTDTLTCKPPEPTTQACCEEKNDNCCY